ncbi:hypothetical protein HYPSUDRAFT_70184 [Hypholoma sublateritium FD-334 SS-4]|uniref:Ras-domain-containing protein n=1 Tax=Hypholoma sublateritium (strain FD-334 SS-4) TaxID=945553 RepID=A0A0D2NGC5_HYPSF|nr:hypothetical protein HYPSUDRAFT_70184 [Hypholoma sublateritium FD-334 SS-4]
MPVVKLVVIGPSGVGKTSLRGKYIEGHFSTGYRATIGADFITKTLPHPTNAAEAVTLQIWDTAGQERFSSLSTAFFRGADAALLMFDVNAPETMHALTKWWADFCARAPLADADAQDYCVVVVGNKIDMAGKGAGLVSASEALEFLDELVPAPPAVAVLPPAASDGSPELPYRTPAADPPPAARAPSSSIAIPQPGQSGYTFPARGAGTPPAGASPKLRRGTAMAPVRARSRSSSRFYAGTMTTTHTTLTVYHTPSSSLFDVFHSARASPEPGAAASLPVSEVAPRQRTLTMLSTGSTSSGSAPTITPSLVARERAAAAAGTPTSEFQPSVDLASPTDPLGATDMPPLPPERGPRLFFASAKTGEGVTDVFEYIARRVVQKWAYDEWLDARTTHDRETSGAASTVRLESSGRGGGKLGNCCSS